MKTYVREAGDRPTILTSARMNAPAGAQALADLLVDHDFADMSILTIDWEGDGFTPALIIDTVKWFPQFMGKRLEHHWVLSLEDAFGVDNFDNELARQMVNELRIEFERMSSTRPPGWSDK